MSTGENIPVQEIVIIRRKSGDGDDAHHGGMWKIAFADFMTAMMAFFLVMWLINATDEKTLSQVSTYFNPIKLPDQQKTEKAISGTDSSGGENEESTKERPGAKGKKGGGKADEESSASQPTVSEDQLFNDPYGVLAKIANKSVKSATLPVQGIRKDDATQYSGGSAFRDPFDPDFRKRPHADDDVLPGGAGKAQEGPNDGAGTPQTAPKTPGEPSAGEMLATENAQMPQQPVPQPQPETDARTAVKPEPKPEVKPDAKPEAKPDSAGQGGSGTGGSAEASRQAEVSGLETSIREALRQADLRELPDISVTRTAEGILISLTDKLNFEMFGLSSAQPRPEMVSAMEKIGRVLQSRGEKIVVRGHTDARPFRAGTYDNWRLSTDRANIAHYMLARGGLAENRFERIEGYADTNLKVGGDPKAAANRRIEILLRQPGVG